MSWGSPALRGYVASTSDSSSEAQHSRLRSKHFIISACTESSGGRYGTVAQLRGDLTASSYEGLLSPIRQTLCPIQRWDMTFRPRLKDGMQDSIESDPNIWQGCKWDFNRYRSRVLKHAPPSTARPNETKNVTKSFKLIRRFIQSIWKITV